MDVKIPYEESELVALLNQKDNKAFNILYDTYAPALYTAVLQIVRDKETGENVLQKTFMTIWCSINLFEPQKEKLFIWMLQIARNLAIGAVDVEIHQPIGGKEGLAALTEPEIDNFGFKKVTNNLDAEQKTLIELYYYKGLTMEEIAETLSLPAETTKIKIRNALSELRMQLCKK